ncbi:MAG: DUF87 domain-containing protein [Clostridiales bacterium]|nr:DUF87 domain-containing protein [Clostridiales bacterium]
MSYPIFLSMLIYGILLLMNKRVKLSGKQIAFVLLMSLCAVLILQTAVDAKELSGNFGEYLSGLFSISAVGKSVGGVIFGLIVYAIKAVLSIVGAYILYSLLFVMFAGLFVADIRAQGKALAKNNSNAESKKQPFQFIKGKSSAQPVREVHDTTLFVGTIERNKRPTTITGDFSSMPIKNESSIHRYGEATSSDDFGFSQPYSLASDEEKKRKEALDKLYGSPEQARKSYDELLKTNMGIVEHPISGRSNYLIDEQKSDGYGYYAEPTAVTPPKAPAKPPLPDVPVPPTKDVTAHYVAGPILNGETISKNIQDDARLHKQPSVDYVEAVKEEVIPELPPIITGNPVVKSADSYENAPTTQNSFLDSEGVADEPLPIINGDFYAAKSRDLAEKHEEPLVIEDEPVVLEQKEQEVDFALPEEEAAQEYSFEERIVEDSEFVFSEGEDFVDNKENDETRDSGIILGDSTEYEKNEEADKVSSLDVSEEEFESTDGEFYLEINDASNAELSEIQNEIINASPDQAPQPIAVDESYLDNMALDERASEDEIEFSMNDEGQNECENKVEDFAEELVSENESHQIEDTPREAKIPDSLKLIDEEIDMSETREEITDDNTGYYVSEGFNKNVGEISVKLNDSKMEQKQGKGATNQINMDDYDVVVPETAKPKKVKKHLRYTPPPIDLLIDNSTPLDDGEDYEQKAIMLEESLHDLKIGAKVINVTRGPAITRYELEMPLGQSVNKISGRGDDIAYALASNGKIRIEAPIRGKRAVGVEVPNESIAIVSLREIIDSPEFNDAKSALTLALGKGITGNIMTCNLEKMPHLLIAGTTGSGKSACLNSIIISILYKASPDDVRIILIDPKQVEFVQYRDMPHLLMKNIINDSVQACNAFKWAREEMDRRYAIFAQYSVRNLADYNNCEAVKRGIEPKIPRLVIIVDELAELMLAKNSKELEQNIMSLAQKARAAGVHLVLATQRPSVDVLTGTIKANFSSRIAFAVKSMPDSRTILDQVGAETLLGRGDMLYAPIDLNDPVRVQGAYVTTEEVESIVNFVRNNNEADYDETAENIIMKKQEEEVVAVSDEEDGGETAEDPLMKHILRKFIEMNLASASQIVRRFSVGYNRASRIMDQMEEKGYVGPMDGSKSRELYITREKFKEIYGEEV